MSMCHRSAYKLHVKVPQRSNEQEMPYLDMFPDPVDRTGQNNSAMQSRLAKEHPTLFFGRLMRPASPRRKMSPRRAASPRPDPRNGFGEDLETARAMAQLAISVQTEADLTAADAPPSEPAGLNISRRDR